jgi:LmbE family N-acetylglucosaminyl deacetylase
MIARLLLLLLFAPLTLHGGGGNAARMIVVIAPHPDDAEASCGGLIANSVDGGDSVLILTMTAGELGIGGLTKDETRAIRTAEARQAAARLGAGLKFFGAVDGSLAVDTSTTTSLRSILSGVHADIVLAPWPMDVHSDHQASGMLAWRVFLERGSTFSLFFYETSNSPHTVSVGFVPTDYVDVTRTLERKRVALLEQKSQHPEDWWGMYEHMAIVHGYAADVPAAEAYVRARPSSGMGGRSQSTPRTLSK